MFRLMLLALVVGQIGQFQGGPVRAKLPDALVYVAEPAVVAAGKDARVAINLRVRDGLHVNSHKPKSDLLIATAATLAGDEGVRVGAVEYPAGVNYSFASDPGDSLDVYAGEVVLRVPVVAAKGEHVLRGSVRYQACNDRSCFPPKVLVVEVPFTAK